VCLWCFDAVIDYNFNVKYVFLGHRHNMRLKTMNLLAGNSKWAGLRPVGSLVGM
jgi:hypothetical protein